MSTWLGRASSKLRLTAARAPPGQGKRVGAVWARAAPTLTMDRRIDAKAPRPTFVCMRKDSFRSSSSLDSRAQRDRDDQRDECRGRAPGHPPGLDRAGGNRPAVPALLDGPDGAEPGRAAPQ